MTEITNLSFSQSIFAHNSELILKFANHSNLLNQFQFTIHYSFIAELSWLLSLLNIILLNIITVIVNLALIMR